MIVINNSSLTHYVHDLVYGKEGNDVIIGTNTTGRMRRKTRAAPINGSKAANDEITHALRAAA